MIIVNNSGKTEVKSQNRLSAGIYIDILSGNKFEVKEGEIYKDKPQTSWLNYFPKINKKFIIFNKNSLRKKRR